MKRILSLVLLLTLLVGMVPTVAQAETVQPTVENENVTFEGTNGFGTLLSEEIQDHQEEQEGYTAGYSIINLTVENGLATVEYSTLEEANLVVSLYSEDGLQLLVSGNVVVQAEETVAEVTLEGDMPEYFMASAYLLDIYDYSPLCASYDTPMYTKDMQELLASTVDDYDADKVLNLDDDKTTNFAVCADETKIIEYVDGVNTVIGADDETATYIIGNADENITDLQVGDVFVYAYSDDVILIVKVASVKINGTTATITGTDLELEEVFSYAKIEQNSGTSDITVDDTALEEGVTYEGIVDEGVQTYTSRALEGDTGVSSYLAYSWDKTFKRGNNLEASVKFLGTVGIDVNISLSYYISTKTQYFNFETNVGLKLAGSVTGKVEGKFPLGKWSTGIAGMKVGFEPEFKFEFEGKVEISLFAGLTIGLTYDTQSGLVVINGAPKVEPDFEIEGSVFIGIDLVPNIKALNGKVVEAKLSMPIGFQLDAAMRGTGMGESATQGDCVHGCKACVEIQLHFKIEGAASIKFFNSKKLTWKKNLAVVNVKIGDFYWSVDKGEFGKGQCPYIKYKVTVQTKIDDSRSISNINVVAIPKGSKTEIPLGKTNSNGVLTAYLKPDTYKFVADFTDKQYEKAATIVDSTKVILAKNGPTLTTIFNSGTYNEGNIIDPGAVVDSGKCGDNVYWTLYGSGLLTIDGSGEMTNYPTEKAPWDNYSLKSVRIADGVTSIGNGAFYQKFNLTSVIIPDSVTEIGTSAFEQCEGLTSITIPTSVTSIGASAFDGCSSLTSIVIPNGVSTIGFQTFWHCESLTSITIPDSITSIEAAAFCGCSNLTSITIPGSVTQIGYGAFENCDNLSDIYYNGTEMMWKQIDIDENHNEALVNANVHFEPGPVDGGSCGDNVKWLLEWTGEENILTISGTGKMTDYENYNDIPWREYWLDMDEIVIEPGVTTIGNYAFVNCEPMSVVIPDSVVRIGDYAFEWTEQITSIVIPDSVTSIGKGAFQYSMHLTDVTLSNNLTSISEDMFCGCEDLVSIVIPSGVVSVGSGTFADCCSLTDITIPESVNYIDRYAFEYCSELSNVYYEGSESQWSLINIEEDNGNLTSAIIHYNSSMTAVLTEYWINEEINQMTGADTPSLFSIFDGEYNTEVTDEYTLKTASFSGLVPGEQYVLLALVSIDIADVLATDNLLYIDQDVAPENGSLVFTYVQRVNTDSAYVMACGASQNNLKDAVVTFSRMLETEDTQSVDPVVSYNDRILEEGIDYVIVGTTDYTQKGTYSCYIRGIHNYSGGIECTYNVLCAHSEVQENTCVACGEIICAVSVDGEGNVVENFSSFADACTYAQISTTLCLQDNNAAMDLILPTGVNLDLNGYTLTADSVLTYSSSAIIDTSEDVSGLLKINDTDGNMISKDNSSLPVYDAKAGGYRFFAIDVQPCAVTGGNKYWFKIKTEKFAPLYELINADADVQIKVKMTWDGQTEDVYAAADLAFTKVWADRYNANEDIYITVTATEAEGLGNFKLIPMITSGSAEISGTEM